MSHRDASGKSPDDSSREILSVIDSVELFPQHLQQLFPLAENRNYFAELTKLPV